MSYYIKISDNGNGIDEENRKKLFFNFSKLEDKQKQNVHGTGLGLSICKQLLEMMGG